MMLSRGRSSLRAAAAAAAAAAGRGTTSSSCCNFLRGSASDPKLLSSACSPNSFPPDWSSSTCCGTLSAKRRGSLWLFRGATSASPSSLPAYFFSSRRIASDAVAIRSIGRPSHHRRPSRSLSSAAAATAGFEDDEVGEEEEAERHQQGEWPALEEEEEEEEKGRRSPAATKKHCSTCSCDGGDGGGDHRHGSSSVVGSKQDPEPEQDEDEIGVLRLRPACDRRIDAAADDDPTLPPPLPEPKFSVRRRVMPDCLVALNSSEGRRRLVESLSHGTAASYVPLTEHYVNQSDPAFCGVTTLLVVLNALGVDPNVRWRGGWRYYGDEETLLALCCLTRERVARVGVTMEEFARLASCQGLRTSMKRPPPPAASAGSDEKTAAAAAAASPASGLDDFRRDVLQVLREDEEEGDCGDGETHSDDDDDDEEMSSGGIVVVSFGRSALGQTGDGHFSPVAAYHEESDSVLVLDVARFKYQPYWARVSDLYDSMTLVDSATDLPRGWFVLRPQPRRKRLRPTGKWITTTSTTSSSGKRKFPPINEEDQRPAHLVPNVEQKASNCPLHSVKVTFCQLAEGNSARKKPKDRKKS